MAGIENRKGWIVEEQDWQEKRVSVEDPVRRAWNSPFFLGGIVQFQMQFVTCSDTHESCGSSDCSKKAGAVRATLYETLRIREDWRRRSIRLTRIDMGQEPLSSDVSTYSCSLPTGSGGGPPGVIPRKQYCNLPSTSRSWLLITFLSNPRCGHFGHSIIQSPPDIRRQD